MIFLLPSEVVLEICSYLDTVDILSLRQTGAHLASITQDKLIWANLVQQQRGRIPLPPDAQEKLDEWTSDALETLVLLNELVDSLWLVPRQSAPVKLNEKIRNKSLIGLEIFLDRWILAVYADGFVHLWDTEERWDCNIYTSIHDALSYKGVLDDSGVKLTIVIMTAQSSSSQTATMYEALLSNSPSKFVLVRTFPASASWVVRQICPRQRLVLFSQLSSVKIVQWPEAESEEDVILVAKTTQSNELDEMFTTILSLRLLDQYILVFKTRSIELHPIFNAGYNVTPPTVLRHDLPSYNFREGHISDVEQSRCFSQGEKCFTARILASDLIQGLFYFVANVSVPTTSSLQSPLLDVRLTAVYAMVNLIPLHISSNSQQLNSDSDNNFVGPVEMAMGTTSSPEHERRSSSFVATYAMGSQGIRAIWIERSRKTALKQIVACRLIPNDEESDSFSALKQPEGSSHPGNGIPYALDGHVIHSIQSYDLREDIIFCALGEVSGKIVLGNRSGDVSILDTGV